MRKELYNALIEALKTVDDGAIKHIDLWNENVYFIDEETAFDMPAVFVEFGEVTWQPLQGRSQARGTGTFSLHVVTEWNGSAAAGSTEMETLLDTLDFSNRIHEAITGLRGEAFGSINLLKTLTNHNHTEIMENIETYSVKFMMEV